MTMACTVTAEPLMLVLDVQAEYNRLPVLIQYEYHAGGGEHHCRYTLTDGQGEVVATVAGEVLPMAGVLEFTNLADDYYFLVFSVLSAKGGTMQAIASLDKTYEFRVLAEEGS